MANPHIKTCPTSSVTRKYKLKQGGNSTHPSEWPKSKSQKQTEDVSRRNSHSLLVGIQKGTAILTVWQLLKTKPSFHGILPPVLPEAWKLIHTTPAHGGLEQLSSKCPNVETAKMFFMGRWTDQGHPYNGVLFSAK